MAVQCPRCGSENVRVISTRPGVKERMTRRTNICMECGFRYKSCEWVANPINIRLVESQRKVYSFSAFSLYEELVVATKDASYLVQLMNDIQLALTKYQDGRISVKDYCILVGSYIWAYNHDACLRFFLYSDNVIRTCLDTYYAEILTSVIAKAATLKLGESNRITSKYYFKPYIPGVNRGNANKKPMDYQELGYDDDITTKDAMLKLFEGEDVDEE